MAPVPFIAEQPENFVSPKRTKTPKLPPPVALRWTGKYWLVPLLLGFAFNPSGNRELLACCWRLHDM
jgi:hypothetical protein